METSIEFFLYLVGNGKNPGSLPKNSQKVKKREASKGLWSIGATTARSFTADGGLLHPTGGVKTDTFKRPVFSMWNMQDLGYRLSWRWQDKVGLQHPRRKELCTWKIEYAWWNEVDVSNLLAERWDVRHRWQREKPRSTQSTWNPTMTWQTWWTRECACSC